MATLLQRNKKSYPFTNRLQVDKDGKVSAETLQRELERMYRFLDDQAQQDFDTLAERIYEIEVFVGM